MIHSPLASPSVRSTCMPRYLTASRTLAARALVWRLLVARGHDHALEQRRQVLGVEDRDVLGLDVFETVDDGALQFADVHSVPGGTVCVRR